ncbi:hypothetical protein [Rhodococcoides kroppenstedtii]|uniref:hypothetical protein n=1 Tax=Rhodococcoides kroppenstedtii TaxID=293050 RepID=UPI0028E5A9E0|nr:hypothetical protein [Rhodococcus kroppenstedtii]
MTNRLKVAGRPSPPPPDHALVDYRSRGERLTEPAQTKLTPSEKARLNGFVDYAREHGIDITTPAAAIRYFIVSGLDAIDAEKRAV